MARLRRFASKRSARVRRSLRLPPATYRSTQANRQFGINVDASYRPDDRTVLIVGWLVDADGILDRLELSTSSRVIETRHVRFRRNDVTREFQCPPDHPPGLTLFGEFETETDLSAPLHLDVHLRDGRAWRVSLPAPTTTCPFRTRDRIVDWLPFLTGSEDGTDVMRAALARTMARCRGSRATAREWELGTPPPQPRVSIVIPLFGKPDLLESQFTAFARDPSLLEMAELIYVVDDPRQLDTIQRLSRDLHALYPVPARFVGLVENCGYGPASNEGASRARSPYVLLMNSDVFPQRSGWLPALLKEFESQADAGILAPTLTYENGAIQHAGLFWEPAPVRIHDNEGHTRDIEIWKNHQFAKGYPSGLARANGTEEVPAVATACALMETRVFHELRGFDETFLFGDCEDSELCLRIAERGLRVLHTPSITLLHLEGQSYPSKLRRQVSVYNNWLQHQMWHKAMTERMRLFSNP